MTYKEQLEQIEKTEKLINSTLQDVEKLRAKKISMPQDIVDFLADWQNGKWK